VSPTVDATVAILTYNGETYLEAILGALSVQRFDGNFEILVIDSGSTDRTLDILRKHPEVRLHQIPNSEYGHGKTRNLAAELAQGTYIAYLTHDAIPATDRWLHEITAPLRASEFDVKAVMGKQIPRPACFPLMKYEIRMVFAGFGPDFGTTVFYNDGFANSQGLIDALAFYSDVNSATTTDFLRNEIPYRDVRYSEDMMFGEDLIRAGHRKVYAPRASVVHSNDLTLHEYRQRIFDETVALRQIGKPIGPLARRGQLTLTVRGVLADSLRIMKDSEYSWKRKLYWLAFNPRYHVAKWASYRTATLVDLDDASAISAGSLEHSRKMKDKE
jgi:rhamnosyltransferase